MVRRRRRRQIIIVSMAGAVIVLTVWQTQSMVSPISSSGANVSFVRWWTVNSAALEEFQADFTRFTRAAMSANDSSAALALTSVSHALDQLLAVRSPNLRARVALAQLQSELPNARRVLLENQPMLNSTVATNRFVVVRLSGALRFASAASLCLSQSGVGL